MNGLTACAAYSTQDAIVNIQVSKADEAVFAEHTNWSELVMQPSGNRPAVALVETGALGSHSC